MDKQIILDYKEYLELINDLEELKRICNELYRRADELTQAEFKFALKRYEDWR